jgi:CheY-like chemotaxis protein
MSDRFQRLASRIKRAEAFLKEGHTVFIVEDDRDTREMLGQFLELEGFHVETAANGRQALDRLNSGLKANVILLDLMMPVMDGWQFRQEQVRNEELADIPVIVVSAGGRELIQRVNANAYVSKPVDLEELLTQITNLVEA